MVDIFVFFPAPSALQQVKSISPDLVQVNRLLRTYKSAWDGLVDCWLVIRIGDPQVQEWRKFNSPDQDGCCA
jgi:D-glycerate 3-kinase